MGGSQADIGRAVVSQLVIRTMIGLTAPEQGVTVTDQQVTAAIARQGGEQAVQESSLAVGGVQAATGDELTLTELARRELPRRLSVTADVASPRTGPRPRRWPARSPPAGRGRGGAGRCRTPSAGSRSRAETPQAAR
ncbi:hypothetical protein [Pseudonocardia sp. ICBG601]|uniref:hypothetical protein n=1 Tax=Pseudonocardia sp. ICBG601 TaxID=2846759 RepID=UPI001CF6E006|nr:hypothetical protein [Pseudonocardia sp. ICBG601]